MSLTTIENTASSGYKFVYGDNTVEFTQGKILVNGSEIITRADVLALIDPVNIVPQFDQLTMDIVPSIELSGFLPDYKNGTYRSIEQELSLYLTEDENRFMSDNKNCFVKEDGADFLVVIYTVSLSPFLDLFGIPNFKLSVPTWLLLRYSKNPKDISAQVDHDEHFIKFEHIISTGTAYFGTESYPQTSRVSYI